MVSMTITSDYRMTKLAIFNVFSKERSFYPII